MTDGGIPTAASSLDQEQNGLQLIDNNGIPEFIHYAGAAPYIINGVFQVNVEVPANAQPPFTLQSISAIGERLTSNSFTLYRQ
jgi:uncharacterized protein (TIGR03437 family)